jgi:hypothetical protein
MKAQAERTESTISSTELAERAVHRRAVEAINWGMPAVNLDLMLQAMIGSAKGKPNQIVYWSRLPDWKIQTLTPNPDVISVKPFFNTKDVGPMVLEIPPANGGSITGTIMDGWQAAMEDVGPAGIDKGIGGKYLILPPGYKGEPPSGYIPLRSMTYQGYALLRSILKSTSDTDIAKAVQYAKRIRFYPLSQADNPPESVFVDAIDVVFDATIPYDVRFFESLDRFVQMEPWLTRDKVMIDVLKTVGIEKGKSFNPDSRKKEILNIAAREAHAWLDARYEAGFPGFYEGRQWAFPAVAEVGEMMGTFYEKPDAYAVDGRGLADSYAYSTVKHIGGGQFYLLTAKDKDGRPLDGASSYKLTVPANAPVKQYWSAVVYDRATHAPVRNVPRASRSSQSQGLQKDPGGSVILYFGPKAPAGKEANWTPTSPDGRFEVLFRLYGPDKSFFEKKWILPDIEKGA